MGFQLALYFILLLLFLFLLCPILQAAESQEPACGKEVCGNITIPSPFGIHSSCYTHSWEKPFINVYGINLEVLDSINSDAILISNPVTYINCDRISEASVSVNLSGTPFFFSSVQNIFGSVGCGNLATVLSNEADSLGGSVQPRCDDGASESGCLTVIREISLPILSFFANMSDMVDPSDYRRKRSCGFASLISYDFNFTDDFDLSNRTHAPTQLQWGTLIYGECYLNDSSDTSCTVDGEYCWSRLSSNHLCSCKRDFGDINYSRSCKGCSTSVGTLLLLLATWSMYKALKRKQKILLKQKYFERNGGLLLQQHLSSNEGNVEKVKLFTSKEMEKATNHYNENRILGQGGQGTVYKGMLIDGSIVAIKKSKMVEGNKFDEKKVEQFINEVIILSQINHRNVVKLLGWCLEAEVPLLVYEFIPNGTLYDLIRNQNEELPLTWEMRLRIAIEIANALFYLHSAASAPIYHRDIKSSNILLDDKYRAKVSDFGTSRSVALEQTHLTSRVQGTFGYMDPEYFRSSQFTEKSDVYSFGVVLIELLTGQKPISAEQSEPENSLFNILDPMVVKVGPEQEIIVVAVLAKRCLNLNGKKRPTMKQVAMELELIKASGGNVIEDHGDEEYEIDDIIHSWETNPSCSMSRTITTNSETFPLNSSF
ncbi:hypothetical protein V6Z11_D09G018300 [Gossypium hirsutum]